MKKAGTLSRGDSGSGDVDLQAIANLLSAVQAQQAATHGTVSLRQPERNVEDVVWNAVVMGHPNRYPGLSQVFSVGTLVAGKLKNVGALPASAVPFVAVGLSGLLNFIWRSQNLGYLAPELAEGWAGTVKVATAEFGRDWAPPIRKPWFASLAKFPVAVDAALKRLDGYAYSEVYNHLEPEMKRIGNQANETLAEIESKHPDVISAATSWIMGTIIQKDTFSALDGSVPEDIDEHLTRIYTELERKAEGRFFPWLDKGFRAVRERPFDELTRWRAGIDPTNAEQKEGAPKRKQKGRSRRRQA